MLSLEISAKGSAHIKTQRRPTRPSGPFRCCIVKRRLSTLASAQHYVLAIFLIQPFTFKFLLTILPITTVVWVSQCVTGKFGPVSAEGTGSNPGVVNQPISEGRVSRGPYPLFLPRTASFCHRNTPSVRAPGTDTTDGLLEVLSVCRV